MITICKDCIFAKWNEGVQADECDFTNKDGVSYLEIFKNKGETFTNPDDYFTSIKRLCRACTKKNEGEELPNNYKEIIAKRITPTVDIVIYGKHEENIKALKNVYKKGYKQVYVAYPEKIGIRQYYDLTAILPNVNIVCQIEYTHPLCEIDSAVDKSKSRYVIFYDSSKEIADNVLESLISLEFDELKEFVCILHSEDDLHGLAVLRKAYRMFGGNREKLIQQKLLEVTAESEMILKWNQK